MGGLLYKHPVENTCSTVSVRLYVSVFVWTSVTLVLSWSLCFFRFPSVLRETACWGGGVKGVMSTGLSVSGFKGTTGVMRRSPLNGTTPGAVLGGGGHRGMSVGVSRLDPTSGPTDTYRRTRSTTDPLVSLS